MLEIHYNFFNDTDKNDSAFSFYESTPDEIGMLVRKLLNKCLPFDKIATLIFEKMSHIQAWVI